MKLSKDSLTVRGSFFMSQRIKTIIIALILIAGTLLLRLCNQPESNETESLSQTEADAALFEAVIDGDSFFESLFADNPSGSLSSIPEAGSDEFLAEVDRMEQVVELLELRQQFNVKIEAEIERLLAELNSQSFEDELEDFDDTSFPEM